MNLCVNATESTLLIIDWQERLRPAINEGNQCVENTCNLLRCAEMLQLPTIATEQMPERLGATIGEVQSLHSGPVLQKTSFNACTEQALLSALATRKEVIVSGAETHICVLQTVMGLLERGYTVWVVADACGSRTEANKQAGLDRMRAAGATIVTTEMVIFECLQAADHPRFREAISLIK